jgi:hypothetical protein
MGIEPATVLLVAYCNNHLRYCITLATFPRFCCWLGFKRTQLQSPTLHFIPLQLILILLHPFMGSTSCLSTFGLHAHFCIPPYVFLPHVFTRSFFFSQYVIFVYSSVVTICTTRFNIKKFYVLPTQCIYVFSVDLRTNSDYFTVQH